MGRPRVHAITGKACNGLSWRIGLTILATIHLARRGDGALQAGTHTDVLLSRCALRLRHGLFGGSNGPLIDRSFNVARFYVRAHPDTRPMS